MTLSTKAFVAFVLFNILNKHSSVLCEEYYIAPTENCSTSEAPCLSLSELANNLSSYVGTNTTLVFLEENHMLDVPFFVSDVAWFSMISNGTSVSSITCSANANFTFLNVNRVYIRGLTFTACGGNKVDSVYELAIEHSNLYGQKNSPSALKVMQRLLEHHLFAMNLDLIPVWDSLNH